MTKIEQLSYDNECHLSEKKLQWSKCVRKKREFVINLDERFMGYSMKTNKGFSLIELLITISIIGFAAGVLGPPLYGLIRGNQVEAWNNDLIAALSLARSEAISRSKNVIICVSQDGATCSGDGDNDWSSGWIVFADDNANNNIDNDEILQIFDTQDDSAVISRNGAGGTAGKITYNSRGLITGGVGTLTICSAGLGAGTEASVQGRQITLTAVGRVTMAQFVC